MNESDQNKRIIRLIWISVVVVIAIVLLVLAIHAYRNYTPESEFVENTVPLPTVSQQQVDIPSFKFTNITEASGVVFSHVNGAYGERLLPETMGGGIAFLDYDLDGDQDLLLINSMQWDWDPDAEAPDSRSRMFQNDGSGIFTDVTETVLDLELYGMGVAVGDYDGDTYPDLYVTAVGHNRLLKNMQGTKFLDVTAKQNVGGVESAWSTCATFLDHDLDGDLDLFVCNYVEWSPDIDRSVDFQLVGIGRAYGPPTDFAGTQNWLYRNDEGQFTDVSESAGLYVTNAATGKAVGKALAVLPIDIDGDIDTDLVVANDTVRNFIYINQGDGTFIEEGIDRGIAFDNAGSATGAMGIDMTFVGPHQYLAVAIGNFANEMTSYYVRRSESSLFSDDAMIAGIGAPTRSRLTFGLLFADFDFDGKDELFSVNGHVEPAISQVQASQSYEQAPQLFWACGLDCPRYFVEVSVEGDLAVPIAGRAATYADIDNDGDLDLAVSQVAGRFELFRNDYGGPNKWIRIEPRYVHPNIYAVNSIVEVRLGSIVLKREITPTRSYLSQVELPLTFGLGSNQSADSVTITWPNGEIEFFTDLAANSTHVLQHGTGSVQTTLSK